MPMRRSAVPLRRRLPPPAPSRVLSPARCRCTVASSAAASTSTSPAPRSSFPATAAIAISIPAQLRGHAYSTASAQSTATAAAAAPDVASTSATTTDADVLSSGYDIRDDAYSSPMNEYRRLIDTGALRPDDHQVRIIQKLQDLHDELARYTPAPRAASPSSSSLISRLFGGSVASSSSSDTSASTVPRGLYLYGDVGTGKTMLMDLFFKTLPPRVTRRRRVHFHAFMIDVHKRIHAAKARLGAAGGDPIAPVARELAREARVLCFDEFQVTDIADAMILRRLLETLRDEGVVMVVTSNRHPDELYKNGIQRSSFIPAIELLKSSFSVTDLDSGTDYRRIPRSLSNVYYDPLDASTRAEIDKLFTGLTSASGTPPVEGREIAIWGRTLRVPLSAGRVARFDFNDLCGAPLAAADYLELTRHFGTVFVCEVPKMGLGEKDKARRFITFVDACYESKTKLIVSSEVPIYQIFAGDGAGGGAGGGGGSGGGGAISDHMRSVMDDLGLPADVVGSSSMFSGEEEVFAFARCCSRLVQMGSKEWAETAGM